MKKLLVAILLVASMTLAGCGSNSSPTGSIRGSWSAVLTNGDLTPAFNFTAALVEKGDGTLTISNFSFSSDSPCFVSGETVNGTFTLSGDFNGNVTGTFGFVVLSGSPAGNTLTLSGAANGNKITGTWSLTGGSGCTGSGLFTMTKQ